MIQNFSRFEGQRIWRKWFLKEKEAVVDDSVSHHCVIRKSRHIEYSGVRPKGRYVLS